MQDDEDTAFPLFKGATRSPTFLGVPLVPLLVMFMIVAVLGMNFHPGFFAIAPIALLVMNGITKTDDKAFRIMWLYCETTVRNTAKGFWKSSSYSPINYQKRK